MPKLAFSLAGLALVAGCDSPTARAHQAEQRLAMVKAGGATKDEICAASREVADAWLQALDRGRYQLTKLESDIACNEAALAHLRADT